MSLYFIFHGSLYLVILNTKLLNKMKIQNKTFVDGYNPIVEFQSMPWDAPKNPKMDFGILILRSGNSYVSKKGLERAYLLMQGRVLVKWAENTKEIYRKSIWTDNPWCLHVPHSIDVTIEVMSDKAELAVIATPNENDFSPKLYTPVECQSEYRGAGTMRETSTRIVRTIFDDNNSPNANLVLGEVINFPGKWSSYPPHWHPQPEIYHYRFLPEQGFGFSMLGEDAEQVHNGDTILIFNEAHSQTSAPGYAMYYIWPIRHLEGNRYGPSTNTPEFDKKHLWVTKPENQTKIFPPEE